MDEQDHLDPVNAVVNLFLQEDAAEAAGVLKTVSLRLPLAGLARVDGMASYANQSRQSMLRHLIRAGIAAVLAELPPDVRVELDEDYMARREEVE